MISCIISLYPHLRKTLTRDLFPCHLPTPQAFATFDRDCKGYLSRVELRTMLYRCGLQGNEAEFSALKDAMVRKGSRGLTYFDLKNFLESYSHTTVPKSKSGSANTLLGASAHEGELHFKEVMRVQGACHII